MKVLAPLLSIVLVGRARAGVDVAAEAGRRFVQAQAAHERALTTAAASEYAAALSAYGDVLKLMGGRHPATQYYLGTCQLDCGDIDAGVTNIAAALRAEPDNFDGTATRRLIEARSVQAMQAELPSANNEATFRQERASSHGATFPGLSANYPAPVVVWDNALGDYSSKKVNGNSNSRLDTDDSSSGIITAASSEIDDELLAHLARSAETVFEALSEAAASATSAEVSPSGGAESAPQSSVWYAAGSAPKCGIEALLPELRKLVPGLKGYGGGRSDTTTDDDDGLEGEEWLGCEYWVRVQPAGRGVAAHYDFDVARKRLPSNHPQHGLVAPHRSSIFYLSGAAPPSAAAPAPTGGVTVARSGFESSEAKGGSFGAGPTVLLEQRRALGTSASSNGEVAHEPAHPQAAHFVWPKQGRFAVFDGSLLHGVVPSGETSEVRATLLINWWTASTGPIPGAPHCAPLPFPARSKDAANLKALKAASLLASRKQSESESRGSPRELALAPAAERSGSSAAAVPAVLADCTAGEDLPKELPCRSRLGCTSNGSKGGGVEGGGSGALRWLPVPAPLGGELLHGGHLRVQWTSQEGHLR